MSWAEVSLTVSIYIDWKQGRTRETWRHTAEKQLARAGLFWGTDTLKLQDNSINGNSFLWRPLCPGH